MTNTTEEELILKTDALGRVRMPDDKREMILDRFEQSGMSGKAFAAQLGIKYQTFASWMQKRRRQRGDYPEVEDKTIKTSVTLFEAVVESADSCPSSFGIEIESSHGVRIRLRDRNDIALAIAFLGELKNAQL